MFVCSINSLEFGQMCHCTKSIISTGGFTQWCTVTIYDKPIISANQVSSNYGRAHCFGDINL